MKYKLADLESLDVEIQSEKRMKLLTIYDTLEWWEGESDLSSIIRYAGVSANELIDQINLGFLNKREYLTTENYNE